MIIVNKLTASIRMEKHAMKHFVRIFIILMLFLITVTFLSSCSKYDEDWIIGKTYDEVRERYGEFDWIQPLESTEASVRAGYLIREKNTRSILFYVPADEFYLITFDQNMRAYYIQESYYRPGG